MFIIKLIIVFLIISCDPTLEIPQRCVQVIDLYFSELPVLDRKYLPVMIFPGPILKSENIVPIENGFSPAVPDAPNKMGRSVFFQVFYVNAKVMLKAMSAIGVVNFGYRFFYDFFHFTDYGVHDVSLCSFPIS
jgi:hypothetical protein